MSNQESIRIGALKAEARHHYREFQNATAHLDCGNALAKHISSRASEHARAFNSIMDQLASIDPAAPKDRL